MAVSAFSRCASSPMHTWAIASRTLRFAIVSRVSARCALRTVVDSLAGANALASAACSEGRCWTSGSLAADATSSISSAAALRHLRTKQSIWSSLERSTTP